MLAAMRSSASIAASPIWRPDWPPWRSASPGPADPQFLRAVLDEAMAQDAALIAGIAAYRRHPYRRTLPDPPAIWTEGESRLLDYGGEGPCILFVPSLINRAHVLDLAPGASFMRWLAANGARPLLLDWGWPDAEARRFTLTDYIAGRLERAITALDREIILAGFCMGGLLALAAALRMKRQVRALGLLATPWDFHAEDAPRAIEFGRGITLLEPMMRASGTLPVDALQSMFALLDPFGVGAKYRSFASLDPASPRAIRFVALEDWLNDGVPLAAPVAREAIGGWYGRNAPARGEWRVAGLAVDPSGFDRPAFAAIPARDRLVPPASARALAALLPRAHVVEPAAGHIGMAAGMSAERVLWRPFLQWALDP
ncbi:MAG TPA: alpha/beta hydrolase [Acetobacteraceae bacterium]|nr:alpha/beta hydrolase [Acetobacteraceae bacterium]